MSALLMMIVASGAALATGIPPHDSIVVRGADCTPANTADPDLWVTHDRMSGSCAQAGPGQDGCAVWVVASLSAQDLVVTQQGCDEPLPGRFVRDGTCGDRPRWRWTGTLAPGEAHTIGKDGQQGGGWVQAAGEAPAQVHCPAESPPVDPTSTPVVTSPASPPQWIAFPAEGFSVVEEGELARVVWTPGPSLRQWVLSTDNAVLMSAPMPFEHAQAALDHTLRQPTGIAARHQVVAWREHFEGHRKRQVQYCTRVLEQDVELGLRPADPAGEEVVLRATLTLRDTAPPERCEVGAPSP